MVIRLTITTTKSWGLHLLPRSATNILATNGRNDYCLLRNVSQMQASFYDNLSLPPHSTYWGSCSQTDNHNK